MAMLEDAVLLSYLEAMYEAELDRQKEVVYARKYHEGDHPISLTPRQQTILGANEQTFRLNICQPVVSALTERLQIIRFDSVNDDLIKWATSLWSANRMDALQDDVHEGALRDGEHFVIVSWDNALGRVTLLPHERYTSTTANGNGFGCFMDYPEDDPNLPPNRAVKMWSARDADGVLEQFATVYYPDRIEKFKSGPRGWEERMDPADDAWPLPWVDPEGNPLGIPVIHFKNKGLRCEAAEAWPLQNAVNKGLIDLMMSSDLTAFRIYVALGFIPTTDGKEPKADRSNWLVVEPGQLVGTTKPPSEVSFEAIEAADLAPQQDLVHQIVLWAAMVTQTPVSRFISTKLIASDATLKEQEVPLISRARNRQTLFANPWVECLKMAAKLETQFGDEALVGNLEEFDAKPIWMDAQGIDTLLNNLLKKRQLGVDDEQIFKELGYNQTEVSRMIAARKEAQEKTTENNNGRPN